VAAGALALRRRRRARRRPAIWLLFGLLTVAALAVPKTTQALTISLEADPAAVVLGGEVTIHVVASDLVAGGPPSLRSFDIDLAFDPQTLSLVDARFGDSLGSVASDQILEEARLGDGSVNLAATSLLSSSKLLLLQPDRFELAALILRALVPGELRVSLSRSLFGDSAGTALPLQGGAEVVISVAIPEPGTLALIGIGLATMGASRRRVTRQGQAAAVTSRRPRTSA
jgi:hypothetical protein